MGKLIPGNEASSTFVCQFCLLSPAAFTPTSSTLVLPRLTALYLLLILHPPPSSQLHIKEEKKHMNTKDVSFKCGADVTESRKSELLDVCSFKIPFDF